MKPEKLKSLFDAARREPAPEPGLQFSAQVVSALRREPAGDEPRSMFDDLALLFGRFAWAAVVVIAVCVATEFYFSQQDAGLTTAIEQAKQEWFFAAN